MTGGMIPPAELFDKYGLRNTNTNLLRYYSIRSSISSTWKEIIKSEPIKRTDVNDLANVLLVECDEIFRNVKFINNKFLLDYSCRQNY